MGNKIHPNALRLGYIHDWQSKWFSTKDAPALIGEDFKIRSLVRNAFKSAAVSWVGIERAGSYLRVNIHTARPGVVIGKKGADIEKLRSDLAKMTGSEVSLNIVEIRKPEIDAKLVAQGVADQLERRIAFRRAMKRAVQSALRLGAEGIRITCAGRLGGAEIARTEWYREGRVPLHTLRADIDYGFGEAKTSYGVIGIKVWVYKGEVVPRGEAQAALPGGAAATTAATPAAAPEAPAEPKRGAKKPAGLRTGARRGSAKPKAEGEKPAAKAAKKTDAPAPKTTVKAKKKIVKDEGEKKE